MAPPVYTEDVRHFREFKIQCGLMERQRGEAGNGNGRKGQKNALIVI